MTIINIADNQLNAVMQLLRSKKIASTLGNSEKKKQPLTASEKEELEDRIFGEMIMEAHKEPDYLSPEETEAFIKKLKAHAKK